MAETQDNQYKTINRKNLYNNDDDDVNDVEDMLNKQQQLQLQNIGTKENYNNYQSINSFGDEPVDDLLALANDDATAVETANLLLSENQQNFVDFDEFNICLNNILNDDVDSQLQLSPSEVISNTLTTAEVDELFKVNIDMKTKSLNQIMPTKTLNEKNVCSINSNSSSCSRSNSSSNSSNSKSSLQHYHHHQQQQRHHQHHNNNDEDDDDDLLNMVQFDDFTFSSELESKSTNTNSSTTTTTHLTTSINNANYLDNNTISTRHSLTPNHGHNYALDKNNVHHFTNIDNENNDNVDLDLNMLVDPISIQSTRNPTATVSASLTTTAATNSHMNTDDDDDDDNNVDNETPQETALNNVIKRNSHSIVNIFQ